MHARVAGVRACRAATLEFFSPQNMHVTEVVVLLVSAERKILKLQYEGTDKKRYLFYSNQVLKVGTEIVGVDNPKVCRPFSFLSAIAQVR